MSTKIRHLSGSSMGIRAWKAASVRMLRAPSMLCEYRAANSGDYPVGFLGGLQEDPECRDGCSRVMSDGYQEWISLSTSVDGQSTRALSFLGLVPVYSHSRTLSLSRPSWNV